MNKTDWENFIEENYLYTAILKIDNTEETFIKICFS